MSVILGLNAFHSDASVCIVIDGELKFAVAEERLGNRDKHTPAVPENAIRAALKECGLKLSDVTHVATARSPKSNFSQKVKYSLSNPKRSMGAAWEFVSRNRRSADIIDRLPEICRESPDSAKYEVVNVEHHLAHIASSYYCSPFETLTAGLSYDGSGDFVSMMAARCEGTKLRHSIESHCRIVWASFIPHSVSSSASMNSVKNTRSWGLLRMVMTNTAT